MRAGSGVFQLKLEESVSHSGNVKRVEGDEDTFVILN